MAPSECDWGVCSAPRAGTQLPGDSAGKRREIAGLCHKVECTGQISVFKDMFSSFTKKTKRTPPKHTLILNGGDKCSLLGLNPGDFVSQMSNDMLLGINVLES